MFEHKIIELRPLLPPKFFGRKCSDIDEDSAGKFQQWLQQQLQELKGQCFVNIFFELTITSGKIYFAFAQLNLVKYICLYICFLYQIKSYKLFLFQAFVTLTSLDVAVFQGHN